MEARFTIFTPVKKFYWTPDAISFTLLGVMISFGLLSQKHFLPNITGTVPFIILPIWAIYFFFRAVLRNSSFEVLKGVLGGELVLRENEISIDGHVISTADIKSFDITCNDLVGSNGASYAMKSLNGVKS